MAVTITYYGHSTFTFDVDGTKLVIDPFFAPNNSAAPVKADEIEADYVLVSHGHFDHVADAASIAKRTGATVISNAEIVGWLQKQGVKKVHGMNTGGAFTFPFGRVQMTIAHHSSALPDGANGGNPCGLLFHFNDGSDVYFAGDTALTFDMKLIGEAGGVDLALLPIGDNFTMGPDDAVTAAQFVKAKRDPHALRHLPGHQAGSRAFAETLRQAAEIDCKVLAPGEAYTLA